MLLSLRCTEVVALDTVLSSKPLLLILFFTSSCRNSLPLPDLISSISAVCVV
jgi:hypothetical protein